MLRKGNNLCASKLEASYHNVDGDPVSSFFVDCLSDRLLLLRRRDVLQARSPPSDSLLLSGVQAGL